MPPSGEVASGELWGFHWMPAEIEVDCLLPNGMYVRLVAGRETTLLTLKDALWNEAKQYPMFDLLLAHNYYIFTGVTLDKSSVENFYDESRRLCDLKLFQPVLKLVEPEGNREEKCLDENIGIAIGRPISLLEKHRDPQTVPFRIALFDVCQQAAEQRIPRWNGKDLYGLPMDGVVSNAVSETADGATATVISDSGDAADILICIWNCPADSKAAKITVPVPLSSTPDDLIRLALCKKARRLSIPREHAGTYVEEVAESFVLKVAGRNFYLMDPIPLDDYEYIRLCMSHKRFPNLMLMSREEVLSSLPIRCLVPPSYMRRHGSNVSIPVAINSCNAEGSTSLERYQTLYEVDGFFRLHVLSASFVNIADADEIFVKVGIYHGVQKLHIEDTTRVDIMKPYWDEDVVFNSLYYKDLPCAAQICFALCTCKSRGKQKEEYSALAWANLRLIDYSWCLIQGQKSIHLYYFPKDFDGMLNPCGAIGSNPCRESPCLVVKFQRFDPPVVFPPFSQIKQFFDFKRKWDQESDKPKAIEEIAPEDEVMFTSISKRDPLHQMDEQEKEFMWSMRNYCKQKPNALPRMLDSVRWDHRSETAEVYMLLEQWPNVSPVTALELLDIKYPDPRVRCFALKCLDETLTDDQLLLYLISLSQVLKYEPFYNNGLARFLLKRALLSQRVGHLFFWIFRSEVAYNLNDFRYMFVLEAFCRGCSGYLKTLLRQVDAVTKLEIVNSEMKHEKGDAQETLVEKLRGEPLSSLQHIESPLDNADILDELVPERCRILLSAKRPLWLVWSNPDPLADLHHSFHEIIFKSGDDLRQDMLTVQVFKLMDSMWKQSGMNFHLTPYTCLSMGERYGMIEVVRNSKTVMEIQASQGRIGALKGNPSSLHKWLKELNPGDVYDSMIENFTASCAGYCVATFVLGIKDRHSSNIMLTEDGHILHIDFGHFLGHYKKKFGINRERVPFVLTEDFLRVITRGSENPRKTKEFQDFQDLCTRAYLILHQHAHLFISLFSMMLCMGIPELQKMEDINYLRRTLSVEKTDEEAMSYFRQQLKEAYERAWTTKVDGFFHNLAHM